MTTTAPTTYSENVAAQKMGVPRATLGLWRRTGHIRPDLIVEPTGVRPAGLRAAQVNYNAELVEKIAAGEATLDGSTVEK